MSRAVSGILLFLLIVPGFVNVSAQNLSIEVIREQFFAIDKSNEGALKLYKSLENAELSKNPVLMAYRGAASAATAGYVNGVRKKLQYFNNGKNELDKAAGLKPLDAEIRFLRLATQVNAPGFLGYSSDINHDKSMIITTLSSVSVNHANAYLYQRICSFMLTHVNLEPNEKAAVNQLLAKFKSK